MILDHPSILFLWRYLALSGVTWRYLALPGVTWRYLALPGVTWRYLALSGKTSEVEQVISPIILQGKTTEVEQVILPSFLWARPRKLTKIFPHSSRNLQITTDASNLLQVSPVYHRISSRTLSEKFLIQPTYRNIIYHFCYL